MSFVDGYGIKGKFTSNTGKKAAQKNKIKESTRRQKAETFREREKKSLTKSIGTAGPKVRPDGTTKDDKPKVTAQQKEEFRKQEDTYRTKSPGTVGDKYYKNPEGTGTGQGGSGLPVKNTENFVSNTVQSVYTPSASETNNFTYVSNLSDDDKNPFVLKQPETNPLKVDLDNPLAGIALDRTGGGNRINLAQEILYKDWNVVTLSPTWDGLNIDGVKIKVKMPLTTNKSSDFKFKIGG